VIIKFIGSVIGIALAWILLFSLNNLAFSHLELSHFVNWIFLPAGIRLVAVLLFDSVAIVGLFVGAMVTSDFSHTSLPHAIVIAAISAINPYIAVNISKYFLQIDGLLSNLKAPQLLILCSTAAVFNSLAHELYFNSIKLDNTPLSNSITMMIGDFFGCLIMLYLLSIAIKLIRKYIAADHV